MEELEDEIIKYFDKSKLDEFHKTAFLKKESYSEKKIISSKEYIEFELTNKTIRLQKWVNPDQENPADLAAVNDPDQDGLLLQSVLVSFAENKVGVQKERKLIQ